MDTLHIVILIAAFIGMFGIGIYFAVEKMKKRIMAKKLAYRYYDEDLPHGEKKHCDAYSAGVFTW